jgi:1-acyl-sn-glycerol-3-phosphate acyltransferase
MLLFLIISFFALIYSVLFIYYIQVPVSGIIWYTVPLIYIVSWAATLISYVMFLMVTCLFHNRHKKVLAPRKFYSILIYQTAQFLRLIFRIDIQYENRELFSGCHNCLIVSNHQSNLDPLMILASFELPLTFIMKDNLMKVPLIGRFLHAAGFLPLDRKNDRKAMEVILQGVGRLKSGYPLMIYPEGTRSRTDQLLDFRNGAFKLAQKAESPILVLAIDGFHSIPRRFPFRRSKVLIKACRMIPYDVIKDMHTNDIGEMIHDIIAENRQEARKKYHWLYKKEI